MNSYVGTGVTAMLPLVVLTFVLSAFIIKNTAGKIIFTIATLASFGTTVGVAMWYFHQPFSGQGMGWWYGILCIISVITLIVGAAATDG